VNSNTKKRFHIPNGKLSTLFDFSANLSDPLDPERIVYASFCPVDAGVFRRFVVDDSETDFKLLPRNLFARQKRNIVVRTKIART